MASFEQWLRLRESPDLFEALGSATGSELGLQERLRRTYDADVVRAALSLRDARLRAKGRFSRADEMWFGRVGLEQASGELVALHKATRFDGRCWDLCSGIGGDALALGTDADVVAVDRDASKALCCRWNCEAYGVAGRVEVVVADVERLGRMGGLVHIDPDQRPGGARRSHRIEDAEPGRAFLESLMRTAAGGAVKLSPAANFLGKFAGCEVELVSVGRECKQAVIWFGELAGPPPPGQPQLFRATSLPTGETLAGHPLAVLFRMAPVGAFVVDPDPSVVRAGLVDVLADRVDGWRLDEREEYVSSDRPATTSLAQSFRVLSVTAYRIPLVREAARGLDFGPVEIKCRHVPVDASALRKKLKLTGSRPGVIVVAKVDGKTRAVLAERVSSLPEAS